MKNKKLEQKHEDFVNVSLEETHAELSKKFPIDLQAAAPDKKSVIVWALGRIPLFTSWMQRIDQTGEKIDDSISKVLGDHKSLKDISKTFHITGVVLAGLDFIRMPLIVLGGLIQGKTLLFSLSKTAKWVYSGIVFGLALAALLIPFAAPFIGLTLAITGLITSVIAVGNVFYARKNLKVQQAGLVTQINTLNAVREELLKEASLLQTRFSRLSEKEKTEQRTQCQQDLSHVGEKLSANRDARQHCLNNLEKNKQKNAALAGPGAVVKKMVPTLLACGVLAGAALSLVFPPVGAIVLAACAGAGFLFAVGGMIATFVSDKLKARQAAKVGENPMTHVNLEEPVDDILSKQQNVETASWVDNPMEDFGVQVNEHVSEDQPVHESEGDILKGLGVSLTEELLVHKDDNQREKNPANKYHASLHLSQLIENPNVTPQKKDEEGEGEPIHPSGY